MGRAQRAVRPREWRQGVLTHTGVTKQKGLLIEALKGTLFLGRHDPQVCSSLVENLWQTKVTLLLKSNVMNPWVSIGISRGAGVTQSNASLKGHPRKGRTEAGTLDSPHNLQAAQQVWASPLGQPLSRPSSPPRAVVHCFYNLLSQTPACIGFLNFRNVSSQRKLLHNFNAQSSWKGLIPLPVVLMVGFLMLSPGNMYIPTIKAYLHRFPQCCLVILSCIHCIFTHSPISCPQHTDT